MYDMPAGVDEDDFEATELECLMAEKEYDLWMERQESKRKTLLVSQQACPDASAFKRYILWEEREG